jgi:polyhydroxybutyrate depolymerase
VPRKNAVLAVFLLRALAATGCGGAVDDGADDRDGGPMDDGADSGDAAQAGGPVHADAGAANRDAGLQDVMPDASGDASDSAVEDSGGIGDDRRSAGCSKAKRGSGEFERLSLRAAGRDRTYYVRVPTSYQASRAYPLVFRWHGTSGDGLSGGLDIEYPAGDDAIVVGADGLVQPEEPDVKGWGRSTEADDLALFDAMYQQLSEDYCVDLKRVFSYGFSAGGGMTNMLSCKRGDTLRASAAIAGYVWGDLSACDTPVAAWFLHDRDDDAVSIAQGRDGRDLAIARNECASTTKPAAGGCVSYDGCKPGFPVIWCETQGLGHNIAGETAPAQVWAFFAGLP